MKEADLQIQTKRLLLEPVTEAHAQELWELFRDPDLHHFVPFEVPTLEQQRERCARWAKRPSRTSIVKLVSGEFP
jgi:hypothetical protein